MSNVDNVTSQKREDFDMSYFIALLLLLIIASLAVAGFVMLRKPVPSTQNAKQKNPKSMARALTVRILLSVLLFVSVLIAWQLGIIQPTGVPFGA